MERSRTEIGLFAVGAFSVWCFVWGVIAAVLILLAVLAGFALRNSE
jgi:hypothetical protein